MHKQTIPSVRIEPSKALILFCTLKINPLRMLALKRMVRAQREKRLNSQSMSSRMPNLIKAMDKLVDVFHS